jgi:hypothetical protein
MKNWLILMIVLMLTPLSLLAWPSYRSMSTPNFSVYHRDGWEQEALNLLQIMEHSRSYVESLTGNKLGKIPMVIEDMGNMVNGYANPVGTKIAVFAYPPTSDVLAMGEDWWQTVGVHEYIHMAQMTKVSGEPALLRALFGNLLYPNLYQPMWMTEGITVYGESQLSKYSGRMNGATYPAIISALAREGKLPSPSKAGYISYDAPQGNYYVYGGSFYTYLSNTYGEDKFAQLFERTGSSLLSYLNPLASGLTLDKEYEAVYGKNLQLLWQDWQVSEVKKPFSLPKDKLSDHGWMPQDLRYHNGCLYYTYYKTDKTGPFSGFSGYKLVRVIDPTGRAETQTLLGQRSEFPASYQVYDDGVYYSRLEMRRGFDNNEFDGWGAITEIWKMDHSGTVRRKIASGAIRAFCKMSDGTLLLAEDDANHKRSLVSKLDPATGNKQQLFSSDYLIGTMHNSGNKIVVTAKGAWQNNSIYLLDVSGAKLTPLINTPSMETVVDVKGSDLIFDAVYDNRNGSYLYKLDTGQVFQFSGFDEVRSVAMGPKGETWFISMNSLGQDVYTDMLKLKPYNLPTQTPAVQPFPKLSYPKDYIVAEKYPVQHGGYSSSLLHMLWPRLYRIPLIMGTEDSLVVGAQLAGNDIVGDFPYWDAGILYDISQQKWGFAANLENNFFRPIKNNISYSTFDGGALSSSQYVLLKTRSNYGLNDMWAGFGISTDNGFVRKLWYPYLGMNFSWQDVRLQTSNQLMIETKDFWASDRDRLGWQGRFDLRFKSALNSEIRSSLLAAWDPDADAGDVFGSIRGYDTNWQPTRGISIRNSIYKPILKIREGLWNPNVYLEDISLGLFYDASIPWDRQNEDWRSSTGLEIVAELHAGYVFRSDMGIRFSYNQDKEFKIGMIFGLNY